MLPRKLNFFFVPVLRKNIISNLIGITLKLKIVLGGMVIGPLSVAVNNGEVGWQVVPCHRALRRCGSGGPKALLGRQGQWGEFGH